MSPLVKNDKDVNNKDLANNNSVMDRKTDRKNIKTIEKQGKIDTSELPSDLAEIVALWPELPEHIKAAIKALIETHTKGQK
jgi:hypothetical protein